MRRAAKIDANQTQIVEALRKAGASVQSLAAVGDGCPDLLCGAHGKTLLLEVKDGDRVPSQRKLRPLQEVWHSNWRGDAVLVVYSVEDALKAIGSMK